MRYLETTIELRLVPKYDNRNHHRHRSFATTTIAHAAHSHHHTRTNDDKNTLRWVLQNPIPNYPEIVLARAFNEALMRLCPLCPQRPSFAPAANEQAPATFLLAARDDSHRFSSLPVHFSFGHGGIMTITIFSPLFRSASPRLLHLTSALTSASYTMDGRRLRQEQLPMFVTSLGHCPIVLAIPWCGVTEQSKTCRLAVQNFCVPTVLHET